MLINRTTFGKVLPNSVNFRNFVVKHCKMLKSCVLNNTWNLWQQCQILTQFRLSPICNITMLDIKNFTDFVDFNDQVKVLYNTGNSVNQICWYTWQQCINCCLIDIYMRNCNFMWNIYWQSVWHYNWLCKSSIPAENP